MFTLFRKLIASFKYPQVLKKFYASPYNRQWLSLPCIEVYLRKAVHTYIPPATNFGKYEIVELPGAPRAFTPSQCAKTIDIASVEVYEQHRSKGFFTMFLSCVEELADQEGRAVYVESVMESRLAGFLIARGYIQTDKLDPGFTNPAPSFIRIVKGIDYSYKDK